MSFPLFLLLAFTPPPYAAQLQSPVVNPSVATHPNADPPIPIIPPAPNPIDPYDPYGSRSGYQGSPFSEANAAAIHFLNIVDNQVYGGAWLEAGGIMHDIVPQAVWAAGMRAVRMPLGLVRSRKIDAYKAVDVLPGGLTGNFMLIHFETDFARAHNVTETVTLMMHPPLGLWKVICYRIEP